MARTKIRRRRRYRSVTFGLVGIALLTLTGCGETLEERIANRDKCVAADGVYTEGENGLGFFRWECDLTTDTEED